MVFLVSGCSFNYTARITGVYQFSDQRVVSIRRSAGKILRYRFYKDGKSGRLYPKGRNLYVSGRGFSQRSPEELSVVFSSKTGHSSRTLEWRKNGHESTKAQRLGKEIHVRFSSGDIHLYGRLNLPEGRGPFPAVVIIHGSDRSPASQFYFQGDFFASRGIAALTFDKRGTGRSEGRFTMNFNVLARDAAAAVHYLQSRIDIDPDHIGVSGYSQGGWVAPLAASVCKEVKYVLIHYGLAVSPTEEEISEMKDLLFRAGLNETEQTQAMQLVKAAIEVADSRLRTGWKNLRALKKKYRDKPWIGLFHGTLTGAFIQFPPWVIKFFAKSRLPRNLIWHYRPVPVLEQLSIPIAWFFAEEDRDAPPEKSIEIVRRLKEKGKPYRIHLFPDADHDMLTFKQNGDKRKYTGYAKGYFSRMVEQAIEFSRK